MDIWGQTILLKHQGAPQLLSGSSEQRAKEIETGLYRSSGNIRCRISDETSAGFTFIARSYSFDNRHLKETIKRAINHKGLALIDVLQPCPRYNDINTKDWYSGEDRPKDPKTNRPIPRYYDVEKEGFDPKIAPEIGEEELEKKLLQVIVKSREWGDKIPVGVLYQNENTPTYDQRMLKRIESYLDMPPAKQRVSDDEERSVVDLKKLSDQVSV